MTRRTSCAAAPLLMAACEAVLAALFIPAGIEDAGAGRQIEQGDHTIHPLGADRIAELELAVRDDGELEPVHLDALYSPGSNGSIASVPETDRHSPCGRVCLTASVPEEL